jgi:hypothetical protein
MFRALLDPLTAGSKIFGTALPGSNPTHARSLDKVYSKKSPARGLKEMMEPMKLLEPKYLPYELPDERRILSF